MPLGPPPGPAGPLCPIHFRLPNSMQPPTPPPAPTPVQTGACERARARSNAPAPARPHRAGWWSCCTRRPSPRPRTSRLSPTAPRRKGPVLRPADSARPSDRPAGQAVATVLFRADQSPVRLRAPRSHHGACPPVVLVLAVGPLASPPVWLPGCPLRYPCSSACVGCVSLLSACLLYLTVGAQRCHNSVVISGATTRLLLAVPQLGCYLACPAVVVRAGSITGGQAVKIATQPGGRVG